MYGRDVTTLYGVSKRPFVGRPGLESSGRADVASTSSVLGGARPALVQGWSGPVFQATCRLVLPSAGETTRRCRPACLG